jgi:hypothetical protein
MVAIMELDSQVRKHLRKQAERGKPAEYSEAWREEQWPDSRSHLAVLVADNAVVRVGRVRAGQGVTSRDRRVTVAEISEIRPPISVDELKEFLVDEYRHIVDRRGLLLPGEDPALIEAILSVQPGLEGLISHLGRPDVATSENDHRAEVLNQQRDAVGVLIDIGIGGEGKKVLRSWVEPAADAPFLEGLSNLALEDDLIGHDIERFGSWVEVPNARVGMKVFREGNRRMFVMDANRTPIEQTLGVDVVYFNEARDSFVLVQYKKMRPDSKGGKGRQYYRPDEGLDKELRRMRAVDELCGPVAGEFRLYPMPCWMKLCDPDPRIDDQAALIKGMYLAREHFEELMNTCKGPQGGIRFGYDNVSRYLNNTTFTDLVRDGWIGSRGPATKEIQRLIRASLDSGKAVVVGIQRN